MMNVNLILAVIPLYTCVLFTASSQLSGFDDSALYSINWLAKNEESQLFSESEKNEESRNYQIIAVQTDKNEKYECRIPKPVEKEKDVTEKYTGPNPLDILSDLFASTSCSYRFEAYWTYQLCHGQFIRQYHEEREGKKVKLQEYYLGKWDKSQQEVLRQVLEDDIATRPSYAVPVKKVDGVNMPYIQVNMTDGTLCDLTPKPRQTNVIYVCYALGKHEIYSLKETSTCEYEVIVLSPLLCAHPRYRPKDTGETAIDCKPVNEAFTKPKALSQMEAESLKLRHQKVIEKGDPLAVLSMRTVVGEDGVPRVRVEILPLNNAVPGLEVDGPAAPTDSFSKIDDGFANFALGRDCIQGGSGWWKYEFCYGKSVTQFHLEKDGTKTTLNLGNFIKSGHLKWLAANPHKRPVAGSHLSFLYTMGSDCEETGQPRQTEVKLKCVESRSPGAVSLYLLEPRTCNYILGLESQLVCRLLQHVDEDGLLMHEDVIGFSRADYSSGYLPKIEAAEDKAKKQETFKVTLVMADDENLENEIPHDDE